jgi:excinuclease UvrABC ATPase subunit
MALKLFCSKCEEKIKEVTPDEASRLSEQVICKKCEDFVFSMRLEFEKLCKTEQNKINAAINKGMVKIEELMRKALD